MNKRHLIKQKVIEKLGALTDVSLFRSRRLALQGSELPAIVVSIDDETNELFSQSAQEIKKVAQLAIEIITEDCDGEVDLKLDQMSRQIEEILHPNESLGDLIDRCLLKRTETGVFREGELDLGMARMNYEITYYANPAPTAVDDFTGANLHLKASPQ